ncbi:MAG: heavy metal-responsive transcriptional regulator [Gemmatimonadota bacterium]|nr:heavy metal-responsive transcriptional regulator [Gemmatimonadota bacterium]
MIPEDGQRIGEVAAAAGVTSQTLRYYERRGLIPAPLRSAAGYRRYPSDTVRRVRFIRSAQRLGFTLEETKALLALRAPGPRSGTRVRTLAAAKVAEIDDRIARLAAMRASLDAIIASCDCGRSGRPCGILDAIEADG